MLPLVGTYVGLIGSCRPGPVGYEPERLGTGPPNRPTHPATRARSHWMERRCGSKIGTDEFQYGEHSRCARIRVGGSFAAMSAGPDASEIVHELAWGQAAATEPSEAVIPGRGTRIDRFLVTSQLAQGKHAGVLQARVEGGSFVVALKLARTQTGAELVDREARLLQTVNAGDAAAGPTACFHGAGAAGGRRYCASGWTSGVEVRVVAAEVREQGWFVPVLDLCRRLAGAYALLHARGVLHGQVHPRHVMVDGDGRVGLLDFSLAVSQTDAPPAAALAARFNSLSAPEHAESLLRAEDLTITAASEQYSLAALLYLLITGRMYAPLRLTRRVLARDILDSSPRRFSDHGLTAWPELEAILCRALERDPARRYESMDGLVRALAIVTGPGGARRRSPARPVIPRVEPPLTAVLEAFRRGASRERATASLAAPTCSINLGAAGVAFALTRLGKITGDAAALDQAERWLAAAERHRSDANAFDDGDELTPETVGPISPYHTASGVAVARAFLSAARGDAAGQQEALDDFRTLTAAPCANLDLTLGRSSVLLFAALLYGAAQAEWPATEMLADYGDRLCAEVWHDLPEWLPYYGIAHGWAGIAFATMMWTQTRGSRPPKGVGRVLEMLEAAAEPWERGLRWPLTPADGLLPDQFWPGWCHGNAGYVFLWNLARAVYGEDRFATLAERAAWLIHRSPGFTSLCCGSAGQAYALLNQYRSSNEERWREKAIRLATDAATTDGLAEDATSPLCLYKGHVGLVLLAAELEHPEQAAMPLFESEPRC